MTEKELHERLRPITNSLDRLVPTNRALLNFINSKARGTGLDLSFHKVKFLNKSEKSTYACMNVELMEFRKYLEDTYAEAAEAEELTQKAAEVLEEARKQVEKVYQEVRRYIITSEIRKNCIEKYYKPVPSLSKAQNELVAKEVFTLAYEENSRSGEHEINDILLQFRSINLIGISLFAAAEEGKHKK